MVQDVAVLLIEEAVLVVHSVTRRLFSQLVVISMFLGICQTSYLTVLGVN